MSGLESTVKTKLIVSVKSHKESESNFQSTWKPIWIGQINQQIDEHDRKDLFVFAQSSFMDEQKVESREFTVYTTSRKEAHSGWLTCT